MEPERPVQYVRGFLAMPTDNVSEFRQMNFTSSSYQFLLLFSRAYDRPSLEHLYVNLVQKECVAGSNNWRICHKIATIKER